MVHIYTSDSIRVKEAVKLKDLLNRLPEYMHSRANRYKFEKDAYNFTLGRLLLRGGLSDLDINVNLNEIEFSKTGKPFLRNVFFNISHTEGLVVCAISTDGEIGIDIEKIKTVILDNFEAFFTEEEWLQILNDSSPLNKFYWYWTRKESIIKALGLDLSYLHQIKIDTTKNHFSHNDENFWLKELNFGSDYEAAICFTSPNLKMEHTFVDYLDFL